MKGTVKRRLSTSCGLALACGMLILNAPAANAAPAGRIVMMVGAHTSANAGIYTENPDGSGRTHVLSLGGARSNWAIGGLDVTDDGSMIAATFQPGQLGHIYLMNANGSGFRQLTSGGDDSDPTFSPDGSQLVFTRYINGHDRLYRINSDGTGLVRLTGPAEPEAAFPSWSPDGSKIAFVWYADRRQYIVITNTTGTQFRFVYAASRRSGQIFQLTFTPDSTHITFSKYNSDFTNADLWTVGIHGAGLTRVTNTPKVVETSPAYSPDGSKLACSLQAPQLNFADVLIMNPNGTGRRRLTTSTQDELNLAWGA